MFRPLAVALATLAIATTASAQVLPVPQNVLSLTASAATEVPLDLLSVTLSTTREGPDAATVQSQLKQALDAALTEARRAAKPRLLEVQTGNFSLYPRYSQKGAINGWQGRAELLLEGRDAQAIAELTGRLTTLTVGRVAWGLSREGRERAEAETSAQAIARFRERADTHARQFGFTGYTLREVQVATQEPPMYAMPAARMRMAAGAPPAADEALPVESGKATVTSTVSGSGSSCAEGPYCATQPPSTFRAMPCMFDAVGVHRKAARSPSCSGVVNCSEGCFSASSWRFASSSDTPFAAARASTCFCTSGVSTQPGQMALQVTPVVAFSSAVTLVSPTTPCLAAT